MKAILLLFLSALLNSCFVPSARAETLALKGPVEWNGASAKGNVHVKGVGGVATGSVELEDGKASGTFECMLAAFDTDIAKRNEHMRDKYLETSKFPKAVLVLDPVAVSEAFAWTGKLTLKDQTKPVKGKATWKGGELWAEFVVDLNDFPAIGAPTWQGVFIDKDITVSVKAKTGG